MQHANDKLSACLMQVQCHIAYIIHSFVWRASCMYSFNVSPEDCSSYADEWRTQEPPPDSITDSRPCCVLLSALSFHCCQRSPSTAVSALHPPLSPLSIHRCHRSPSLLSPLSIHCCHRSPSTAVTALHPDAQPIIQDLALDVSNFPQSRNCISH